VNLNQNKKTGGPQKTPSSKGPHPENWGREGGMLREGPRLREKRTSRLNRRKGKASVKPGKKGTSWKKEGRLFEEMRGEAGTGEKTTPTERGRKRGTGLLVSSVKRKRGVLSA